MDHPATKAAGRRAVQLCGCLMVLLVQVLLPLLEGLHQDGQGLQEPRQLEVVAGTIQPSTESTAPAKVADHDACALCLTFQTQRSSFCASEEAGLCQHRPQFVGLIANRQATLPITSPRTGQPRAPPQS